MRFGATAREKHFVLKLKVNSSWNDVNKVEINLYGAEPSFSEAQITVLMKIIGKYHSFYYDMLRKFEHDFSKIDDAKNGGGLIRKVGDSADVAECAVVAEWSDEKKHANVAKEIYFCVYEMKFQAADASEKREEVFEKEEVLKKIWVFGYFRVQQPALYQ